MMRFAALLILIGCFIPCQPSRATPAREVPASVRWSMSSSLGVGSGTLDLTGTKLMQLGVASPRGTFHLEQDVQMQGGRVFIPKGVELAWADVAHRIACEPIREKGRNTFRCLLDSDGDGTLDFALIIGARRTIVWQGTTSFEYLLGRYIALEFVGPTFLAKPITISTIKEEPSSLKVDIYLQGKVGRRGVATSLCASRPDYANVCTDFRYIPLSGGTGEMDFFGFHLVAKLTPNGSATITATPLRGDLVL